MHFKVYQTVRVAKLMAELKAQETACAAQWAAAQQDGPYEKGQAFELLYIFCFL